VDDAKRGSPTRNSWEVTKDIATKSPEWEFLRHCRHALAHGGAVTLSGKEPRFSAEWNGIAITAESQGMPLFAQADLPGLLKIGDPLYLLWDLEQTISDDSG
jgi:hypothetical protein